MRFKHLLIRLFSMLHAAALVDIENGSSDSDKSLKAFSLPLIDIESIDAESLLALRDTEWRVELISTWIQQLLVMHMRTGLLSVPAPMLSRAFHKLSCGMTAFQQSMTIATIPFPFPYAQTCDCLLVLHWLVAPLVMAQWATHPLWASVFAFVQVFVLWAFYFIAIEIENPFTSDANDLDHEAMQEELNRQLATLIASEAHTLPSLLSGVSDKAGSIALGGSSSSFLSAWIALGGDEDCRPTKSAKRG